jgi:hypothetical protein
MRIWQGRNKRALIVFFVFIGVVLLFVTLFVDTIPPRSMTIICMGRIKGSIMAYARAHDCLPGGLDQLPELEGKRVRLKDGWGRKIVYLTTDDGRVTLISYGKDGVEGGAGTSADMVGAFNPRDEQGQWREGSVEWSVDPRHSGLPAEEPVTPSQVPPEEG